jgi:hypothetical protein
MDNEPTTAAATETKSPLLRSASLWSAEQLEKMDQKLFHDKEAAATLTEKEKNAEIEAFIWVHHVDIDQDHIEAAVEAGTWREEFRKARRNPRLLWGLAEVVPVMEEMAAMLKAMPR